MKNKARAGSEERNGSLYLDERKQYGIGNPSSATESASNYLKNRKAPTITKDATVASPLRENTQGTNQNAERGNLYYYGQDYADDPNDVYLDEIQKAVAEKNYKALLQSDIAAYNLKRNSEKYLNGMLANQGLNTQGYGTSAHIGIVNNAANLYAQNLANYNEAQANALTEAQQRAEQKQTEADNQLITFLSYSDGSDASIEGYMDKYGYSKGDDGYWYRKSEDGTPNYSERASSYIMSAIQSAKENSSASSVPDYGAVSDENTVAGAKNALENWASTYEGVNKDGYGSVSELRNAVVGLRDNSQSGPMNNAVGNELNYLEDKVKAGGIQDGTLFKLQRGSGYGESYLVLYLGGRFYIVSDDDREQGEHQVATRYDRYQGPKEEIVGK